MNITEKDLAAYLDGNVDSCQFEDLSYSVKHSNRIKSLVELSEKIDSWMERKSSLPILRRIARRRPKLLDLGLTCCCYNSEQSVSSTPEPDLDCGVIECERVILRDFCIFEDSETLMHRALASGFVKTNGIDFDDVGLLLEQAGLKVIRLYNVDLDTVADFLHHGASLIAVVDGDELSHDSEILSKLYEQDHTDGYNPNRAVLIRGIEPDSKMVSIIDPLVDDQKEKVYSRRHFEEAWNDSSNFLVVVTAK